MAKINFEKFNKPEVEYSLCEKIRNKIQLRTRLRKIYDIFLGSLYGYVNGVSTSKAAFEEQLIFPEDKFVMPEMKDVFGQTHKNFHAYEATIPPFYVRSFKNAFCFTNREEIFSLERSVVLEYTSQKNNPFIGVNRKIFHSKHVKKLDASVALLSLSGLENNYGHWLMECLGRYYLLEKSKFKPDYYVISNHKPFQKQFIDLLGIENNRIIPSSENTLIQARELIVPSLLNNWEYVDYRGYRFYQKQYLPAWIGNLYKEKVLPKIKKTAPQKIYISRKLASSRKIENEDEITAYLVKRGFKVYCLETMTVQEQLELFANASIVVGPHGAGFANMIFSPRNTIIFELFPEFYHDAGLRIPAKTLGLNYFYMVGKTRNIENVHPQKENIYINLNLFIEALNIIFLDKEVQ